MPCYLLLYGIALLRSIRSIDWGNSKTWSHRDWSQWPNTEHEFRLEVYNALDELKDDVPQELYEAVAQALKGDPDGVEDLDI